MVMTGCLSNGGLRSQIQEQERCVLNEMEDKELKWCARA